MQSGSNARLGPEFKWSVDAGLGLPEFKEFGDEQGPSSTKLAGVRLGSGSTRATSNMS